MSKPVFKTNSTVGELYHPAMKITDLGEADQYLEALIEYRVSQGMSRIEALRNELSNLGYFAGYFDNTTRERVEKLFHAKHPIFGSVTTYRG